MSKPSKKLKAELFDQIVNEANLAKITSDGTRIRMIVDAMDSYSYAHRVGNGENTERQQNKIIARAWENLVKVIRRS